MRLTLTGLRNADNPSQEVRDEAGPHGADHDAEHVDGLGEGDEIVVAAHQLELGHHGLGVRVTGKVEPEAGNRMMHK